MFNQKNIYSVQSGLAESFDDSIVSSADVVETYKKELEIDRNGQLTVCYAPFDHINLSARIVIVGLTPGDQQARNALTEYKRSRSTGMSIDRALEEAKVFASFSGPMRTNLIAMLDEIGIQKHLAIESTSDLFSEDSGLCHFTSLLRYPVFVDGNNYSGSPLPSRTSFLWQFVERHFYNELAALPDAIWIPLGSAVKDAFERLIAEGQVDKHHVLMGLPHPSGANAERISYFLGRKPEAELSRKTNAMALDKSKQELLSQLKHGTITPTQQNVAGKTSTADSDDLYCRRFYLEHTTGDKLYAKKLKNRITGVYAYVVSPGGNTRSDAKELETDEELLHHIFDLGFSVRAETLVTATRKRTGLFRSTGKSIRKIVRM